jgi:hypothetical protein
LRGNPRHLDSGNRVARGLTTLVGVRGKPQIIVSDNGTEFTSNVILNRAKDHGCGARGPNQHNRSYCRSVGLLKMWPHRT